MSTEPSEGAVGHGRHGGAPALNHRLARGGSALVFEADLELDAVLDDLAVLDDCALDFTTSTVWMLRTVFDAVATAWRAASLHDRGLVPTISRMMMTPTVHLLARRSIALRSGHHATRPSRARPPRLGGRVVGQHRSQRDRVELVVGALQGEPEEPALVVLHAKLGDLVGGQGRVRE